MRKSIAGFLVAALTASTGLAADLTPTETRWLKGAWPVVAFAKAQQLPLDIVVQPQPAPGAAPLALAFVGGRCKLVLSMRGNPQAEAALARVEPDLIDAALELMAAHELGHCQRYLEGAWYGLPTGFVDGAPEALSPALRAAYQGMRAARREEGYGDLVGLAWTRRFHAPLYARLHAWLVEERSVDLIPGSHHDTLAWVKLARDGDALLEGSIYAGAAAVWTTGLAGDD